MNFPNKNYGLKINLDGFVTHRFHYTEINDAISMLLTPYNDICKAVIDFN